MTQEERVIEWLKRQKNGVFTEEIKKWGLFEFPAITCADRIVRKLQEKGLARSIDIENHKTKKWFYCFKDKNGQQLFL